MVVLGPIEYTEIVLWLISMGILAVTGALFVRDYKRLNNKYFLRISFFFFLFILAKMFRLIVRFYIGEPTPGQPLEGDAFILESVYTIVSYIGLFFVYYALEKDVVKKTHFFFSILVWVTCVVSIIDFITRSLLFVTVILFIATVFGLPLIFLGLAIKSSGVVRRNSIIVAIGVIILFLSIATDIPDGRVIFMWPPLILAIVPPTLLIISCLFLRTGFKTKI